MNSTLDIMMSKDHLLSPFSYHNKIGEVDYSYDLSREEKIAVIVLTILAIPLVIGSVFVFYLMSAYFKQKALEQNYFGLTLKGTCSADHQNVLYHLGFGDFRLNEIIAKSSCCQKQIVNPEFLLDHCQYSYQGMLNTHEVKELKNQSVNERQNFEVPSENDADCVWTYFILTVDPLKG